MARKPLDIPWKELLPDRNDPAPEVEVVGATAPAGGGGGDGPPGELASLTDHQLAEKIERLQKHVDSGFIWKLPDKGTKLRVNLRQLREEQEQRKKLVGPRNKDMVESDEVTPLRFRVSSMSSQSHAQSLFGSHFSPSLEAKTGSGNCASFSEDSRSSRKKHSKNSRKNETNGEQHNARMPPFQCPTSLVKKDKQTSTNGDCRGTASPSSSTLQLGKHPFSHFPKRRRSLENLTSLDLKSTEEDVVLLDEDVVPIQEIHEGDGPDARKEAKIHYPSRDHPECVELCHSDVKCLDPGSYLSSTIMNFYIQYLQRPVPSPVSPCGKPKGEYHFFNTYFYRKLVEAMSCKDESNENFTKLRRWWKGVNIFEKAYIFLPIHGDLHWSLVIICIPAKEDESGPIILHLDSLGFHTSSVIFEIVESYLKEEWNYINENAPPPNVPISERIWKNLSRRIEKKKIMVPQQKNEYDCGLFVLYFMERFIVEAPDRLRKKDLAMFGSKWFQPEQASGLRKRIRELLLKEFESPRLDKDTAELPSCSVSSPEDQ